MKGTNPSPVVSANLDLPIPGEDGSLSYNNDIKVDGSVPYIVALDYLEADGQYKSGDTIHVTAEFNAAVNVSDGM